MPEYAAMNMSRGWRNGKSNGIANDPQWSNNREPGRWHFRILNSGRSVQSFFRRSAILPGWLVASTGRFARTEESQYI
jgi:hypothetical protein